MNLVKLFFLCCSVLLALIASIEGGKSRGGSRGGGGSRTSAVIGAAVGAYATHKVLKKLTPKAPSISVFSEPRPILVVGTRPQSRTSSKNQYIYLASINRTDWTNSKLGELNIRPGDSFSKVIVHHTSSADCYDLSACIKVLKDVEKKNMETRKLDNIGYNFMIGGDGRIYENLGWSMYSKIINSSTLDPISLQVALIGDFTVYPPNEKQMDALDALIKYGDKKDLLKKYVIHAHRDVSCTTSPGDALYALLKKMDRYRSLLDKTLLCQVDIDNSNTTTVSRTEWNAAKLTELNIRPTNSSSKVIVHHTSSSGCHTLTTCIAVLKNVEKTNMETKKLDNIGYNFMIGGDGRVYENLGWSMYSKIIGSATLDPISLQVAFIGDFTVYPPNDKQMEAFKALIKYGDKKDLLKKYQIHGLRDVACSTSPGDALYALLKKMDRYRPVLDTATLC